MPCVGVGIGTDGLPDHMHHPVRAFSFGHQSVECPGGDPHDIASGLIVSGAFHSDPGAVDQGSEQPFHDIVRGVVVLPGKILLQDVGHDVEEARRHLVFRQREGKDRVEDGELGEYVVAEYVTDLPLLPVMGDHRAAVHLRAGTDHGQHAAHRDDLVVRVLHTEIIFLPGILLAIGRDGDRLGIITDRSAAPRPGSVPPCPPGPACIPRRAFPPWDWASRRHPQRSLCRRL